MAINLKEIKEDGIFATKEQTVVRGTKPELMSNVVCIIRHMLEDEIIDEEDLNFIIDLAKKPKGDLKDMALGVLNELIDLLASC